VAHLVNLDLNELLLPSGRMHRDASAPARPRVTGEGAVSGNLTPPNPPTASSSGSVFNSSSGSSTAGAGSGSNSSGSGAGSSANGNSGVSSGISAAPFAPLNGSAVNHQIVRKTSPNAVYNSAAAVQNGAGDSSGQNSSSSGVNGNSNGNSVGEEETAYLSLPAGVHAALVSRLVREVTEKAGVAPGAAAALDAYSDPFAPFAAAAPQYGYPSASAAAANTAAASAAAASAAASRRGSSAVMLPNSPGARAAAKLSSAFALPSSMLPSMPGMPGGMSMPTMPSMMPGFFAASSSSSKHGSGSGSSSSRPSSFSPPHGRNNSTSTSSTTSAAGLDADVIRDAFLCAMVDLLGDLGEHMLPGTGGGGTPGFGWGDISTTPLNSLFDTASFLEKAEQVSRPFVEALSKSQVS
jgi:hypothetical protein